MLFPTYLLIHLPSFSLSEALGSGDMYSYEIQYSFVMIGWVSMLII